jgi:sulfofructose kinase
MSVGSKRVIAVGIAVMDKIFGVADIPSAATKVLAGSYTEIGGGPAATASVAIARLGGVAELWARVGEDAVGRRIVEELRDWGVTTWIRAVPGATSSVSSVLVDSTGERLIVSYTDPQLDPDPSWLPLDRLAGADVVLADMRWPRASEVVLRRAREAGIPTVLDTDLAPDDVMQMLLPLSDFAIFSRPALARVTGLDDTVDALRRAKCLTSGLVGVTVGEDGFWWLEGDAERHEPGFAVQALDTLGAGDVFHGAFALEIAEGRDIRDAARFANAASALKCTRLGGRSGIPTRLEVENLLERVAEHGGEIRSSCPIRGAALL